ncbi:DUF4892 domain-containing protein [Marinobacter sp. X15-166B]|nr:DUF4892 domain-containing protein [Marinobacter sp. X15-166B]
MTTSVLAQGVADRSLVQPFPQSDLEVETSIVSPAHRVLLSPVREVNNQIRSESMVRVPVDGRGQLYQIRPDSSRGEARDHYLRQIQALGGRVLFECTARSCGRSNAWANRIFGQATLYGRDNTQDYLVAAIEVADGERHLLLVYTVTRGNRREYVWVEQLKLGEGAVVPGFATTSARVKGPVSVSWKGGVTYRFDWTANDRREIRNWASQPGARVILLGYSGLNDTETMEASMARASEALEAMSAILQKSGVGAQQQSRLVIGPALVGRTPELPADRIEVVVITAPGEMQ